MIITPIIPAPVALEDGSVLFAACHRSLKEEASMTETVRRGIGMKLRPVRMIPFTTIFGVLPLLLAQDPGAEIQKLPAGVVVGGLIASGDVTLTVMLLIIQAVIRAGIE